MAKGHTDYIDFANPMVQGLISRDYIYIANNTPVEIGWHNEMMMRGTLQPLARDAFVKLEKDARKRLATLRKRKEKKATTEFDDEIQEIQTFLSQF